MHLHVEELGKLFTLILRELAKERGDSMLGMILIMAIIGTVLIGGTVVVFEWRALIGCWPLKTRR